MKALDRTGQEINVQDARHIDTAEAAKMIRKLLKETFPAAKFSVTISRYSMGSSISVNWYDGPTQKYVERVLAPFDTKRFDASDDSSYNVASWLFRSGRVLRCQPNHLLAEPVYFSAYLQVSRSWSPEFQQKVAKQIEAAGHGFPPTDETAERLGFPGSWAMIRAAGENRGLFAPTVRERYLEILR